LIDPANRTVALHRIAAGRYAQPVILELEGRTPMDAVPGVSIDWDRLIEA